MLEDIVKKGQFGAYPVQGYQGPGYSLDPHSSIVGGFGYMSDLAMAPHIQNVYGDIKTGQFDTLNGPSPIYYNTSSRFDFQTGGVGHIDFAQRQAAGTDTPGGFSHLFGSQTPTGSPPHDAYLKSLAYHAVASNSSSSPAFHLQGRKTDTEGTSNLNNNRETMRSNESTGNRVGFNQTQSTPLKSSLKYSKPACLQSVTPHHLQQSMMGKTHQSMFAGGLHGKSMRIHGDHDDLKLKLDKLTAKFLEKHKDKDSFKDTFFDEEIFAEVLDSKNYFKLSLDLMKYVLHSGNLPKKKVEGKKTGVTGLNSLTARR